MAKKSAATHSRAQRNKTKAQKSFELVQPDQESNDKPEMPKGTATTTMAPSTLVMTPQSVVPGQKATEIIPTEENLVKSSAAARMAARRHATQKAQQRSTPTLLTTEHFAYVRRDLITIAILACIMFTAIIAFYLTIGQA